MMTRKLYETHVYVRNLEVSVEFYQKLGMPLAYLLESRRAAFFWFDPNGEKQQMLGIWEVKEKEWTRSHFAFEVTLTELLQANDWLLERGIHPRGSFGKDPSEPIVHSWMPAAAVYFNDPDGNSLEFIAVLDGEPQFDLESTPYLSEWMEKQKK